MNDILEVLERAVSEIKGLQSKVESNLLMTQNITVRMAINQLRHGPIAT